MVDLLCCGHDGEHRFLDGRVFPSRGGGGAPAEAAVSALPSAVRTWGRIDTLDGAAAFRIQAAWGHVADNVSRSRVHHRSGGRKCQGQAGGGADAAGGERGRKSAAGRNPVKGFPSRVWKGSQVSHLWLNRRSLGIDRLDPITRPLSWLGQQTVGTHPRTKGALRITGGPPAGRRIPMGSLMVLEQEHQATHGEGEKEGP